MKYNTLFISDIHLGTSNSQVEKLIKFLQENEFEKIYLVGDIIDMIMMKGKFYWKKKHNKAIQLLLKLSRKSEIIYIVGNHDIYLETLIGKRFDNILIKEQDIHVTKNNEECLVIHGHQFDGAMMSYTWLYWLGSIAYDFSLWINKIVNNIRNIFNLPYWSLSMYLKSKTKKAMKFINNFEDLVSNYALEEKVNTVIAGHIHVKEDRVISDIRYMNCGCWTEYTSCVVETLDGHLKVLDVK